MINTCLGREFPVRYILFNEAVILGWLIWASQAIQYSTEDSFLSLVPAASTTSGVMVNLALLCPPASNVSMQLGPIFMDSGLKLSSMWYAGDPSSWSAWAAEGERLLEVSLRRIHAMTLGGDLKRRPKQTSSFSDLWNGWGMEPLSKMDALAGTDVKTSVIISSKAT